MVDPGGLTKRDCLAGADHGNAEQHVVADLDCLSGRWAASVDDLLAHRKEDWFGPVDDHGVATGHESQRAGFGPRHAAGNR